MNNTLTAALALAEAGYHVAPVYLTRAPDGKKRMWSFCKFDADGNRRGWGALSTTDPATITEWYDAATTHVVTSPKTDDETHDAAYTKRRIRGDRLGVLIDCHKSGIVVLDVDHGDLGIADLRELAGHLPVPTQRTQSGGAHLFYRQHPTRIIHNAVGGAQKKIALVLPDGTPLSNLDLRGAASAGKANGGMVYAAPTTVEGIEGAAYTMDTIVPVVDLPEAPEWLLEARERALTPRGTARRTAAPVATGTRPTGSLEGRAWELANLPIGSAAVQPANDAAYALRPLIRAGVYTEDQVRQALRSAVDTWDDGQDKGYQGIETGLLNGPDPETSSPADDFTEDTLVTKGDWSALARAVNPLLNLRYALEGFYRYDGNVWTRQTEGETTRAARRASDGMKLMDYSGRDPKIITFHPSRSTAADLVAALATEYEDQFEDTDLIPLQNGLYDLDAGALVQHTPATSRDYVLPYAYDPTATCPTWETFLESIGFGPDDQDALAEWFGYVLSGRTDLQKFLYLDGPPRSGKGTTTRVLTALLGDENVGGGSVTSLAHPQGLVNMADKRLAIYGEVRVGKNADKDEIVQAILSITGEDKMFINGKNVTAYSKVLPARLMMCGNGLPWFRDASGALAARMLILKTTNSFVGREDETLGDRLLEELPGIFNWSLRGLVRLRTNRRFTVSTRSTEVVDTYRRDLNPLTEFFEDLYQITGDPTDRVVCADVVKDFVTWDKGIEPFGISRADATIFGQRLREGSYEIDRKKARVGGKLEWVYLGLRKRPVIVQDDVL